MKKYTISVTWGKSSCYYPCGTVPFNWDGHLHMEGGKLITMDLISYKFIQWTQAHEVLTRMYDSDWPIAEERHRIEPHWKSLVDQGGPCTLEGLRLVIEGDEDTVLNLIFDHVTVQIPMRQLISEEYLKFRTGLKYSGNDIEVFLGPDARLRLSRERYLAGLNGEPGWAILPDDFENSPKRNYHALYGAELLPGATLSAPFDIVNYPETADGDCILRLQLAGVMSYNSYVTEEWTDFTVTVGSVTRPVHYQFTTRAAIPTLEDVYISIPWSELKPSGNRITFTLVQSNISIVIHRVYGNAPHPSLKYRLEQLPAIPENNSLHIGCECDLLTPANGDIDELIENIHEDGWGDSIQFRERAASGTAEETARWAAKAAEYGFYATACSGKDENYPIFREKLGDHFLGVHGHEVSNLAYGWGEPDPIEERRNRDLAGCKESYLKRMSAYETIGQAIPMQYLDYEAGVQLEVTETPGSHTTLMLAAGRGAAYVFDRKDYGLHLCNHVQRCPLNYETIRRLFLVSSIAWLNGYTFIYDEEVCQRYCHDTIYAYSDYIPTEYRKLYQNLFHYGNNIKLEKERITTGFLQGNYDFLIGGSQADPYTVRTQFWGAFGPESEGWDFDTPESGWKLLDTYMPGIWLYPVLQDLSKVRTFFSGTPYGQVDLIPATSGADKLSRYEALVLPGWNTMTAELYESLIEYVKRGGHLVLCAAQCSTHLTRQFLIDKQDFAFYADGDLSALAGVKVSAPEGIINTVNFEDETLITDPGVQGLKTELCGAVVLAADQQGRPVLVENRIGKGKVWMLTVGDYWGNDALDEVREAVMRRLAEEHQQEIYLTGHTEEVDYHLYDGDGYSRMVLLNTDWTTSHNRKKVVLHNGADQWNVSVQEGYMKHILILNGKAVAFEVPGSLVKELSFDENGLSFIWESCGDAEVELFGFDGYAVTINGEAFQLTNGHLCRNFGAKWNAVKVQISK